MSRRKRKDSAEIFNQLTMTSRKGKMTQFLEGNPFVLTRRMQHWFGYLLIYQSAEKDIQDNTVFGV
jgi:hypothetical protein